MCSTCLGGCSCSSNSTVLPIGPQGPAGADGTNGANGADGADGAPGMAFYSLALNLEQAGHVTPSYDEVATFIYPGINNVADITSIQAILYTSDASVTGKIKIYDVTNGAPICTFATGTNSTSPYNIVDLGTISNLPLTPAVFAVQVYNSSIVALNKVYLDSLMIGSY